MTKYKDEEIMEAIGKTIVDTLPVIAVLVTYNILAKYVYLPIAFSAGIFGACLIGYWKSKRIKLSFLTWLGISILISALTFVLMHYLGKLGWIDVGCT
jgi:hypothetical protein